MQLAARERPPTSRTPHLSHAHPLCPTPDSPGGSSWIRLPSRLSAVSALRACMHHGTKHAARRRGRGRGSRGRSANTCPPSPPPKHTPNHTNTQQPPGTCTAGGTPPSRQYSRARQRSDVSSDSSGGGGSTCRVWRVGESGERGGGGGSSLAQSAFQSRSLFSLAHTSVWTACRGSGSGRSRRRRAGL